MYKYNRWEANTCTSTAIGKLVHVLVQCMDGKLEHVLVQ